MNTELESVLNPVPWYLAHESNYAFAVRSIAELERLAQTPRLPQGVKSEELR